MGRLIEMSSTSTRILAIRHGETSWNVDTRFQGQIDIDLNPKGQWQAEQLAHSLAEETELSALYSSDLRRAHATAQAVAQRLRLPVQIDAGLRERHGGVFQGRTLTEMDQHDADLARRWRTREVDFRPEGGESLRDFYERSIAAWARVAARHPGQTVAVVAHGGVLDCLYRAATGLTLEAPRTWKIANASVSRLLFHGEGFALMGWGDTQHLESSVSLDESSDVNA